MTDQPSPSHLASRRKDYETAGLDVTDVDANPMAQWHRWYDEAYEGGCVEPNAFVLGTVDADGWPQTRYLLVRGADERGFTFFTNYDSAKSRQLAQRPQASMLFTWLQLHRQVRVLGTVERVPDAESDEYFATRPQPSQVGAWSSPQSQPIPDRQWLEDRVAQMAATFGEQFVPRPAFWGGWLLRPESYEFWQGRPSRLHDRVRYTQVADAGTEGDGNSELDAPEWVIERLAP